MTKLPSSSTTKHLPNLNLNPISSLDEEEGILDIEYITFILFYFLKKGKMGS